MIGQPLGQLGQLFHAVARGRLDGAGLFVQFLTHRFHPGRGFVGGRFGQRVERLHMTFQCRRGRTDFLQGGFGGAAGGCLGQGALFGQLFDRAVQRALRMGEGVLDQPFHLLCLGGEGGAGGLGVLLGLAGKLLAGGGGLFGAGGQRRADLVQQRARLVDGDRHGRGHRAGLADEGIARLGRLGKGGGGGLGQLPGLAAHAGFDPFDLAGRPRGQSRHGLRLGLQRLGQVAPPVLQLIHALGQLRHAGDQPFVDTVQAGLDRASGFVQPAGAVGQFGARLAQPFGQRAGGVHQVLGPVGQLAGGTPRRRGRGVGTLVDRLGHLGQRFVNAGQPLFQ